MMPTYSDFSLTWTAHPYQAGVVKALAEICKEIERPDVFTVITGVSTRAINATFLAARH